jgi:RNA polymerase sigma-70 factor (ECF subfamily)
LVLEGVRARDPEALTYLFNACFPSIYSLLYRLCGDRASAEDLAQEVFLKLHRSADSIDPHRDPGPWLTTIAYNTFRDFWRAGKVRAARSLEGDESLRESIAAKGPDPEQDLIRNESERRVQRALMELSEEHRAVVLLRDFGGLDHPSIAEMVGTTHDAVRKRYSRALKELAKILSEDAR